MRLRVYIFMGLFEKRSKLGLIELKGELIMNKLLFSMKIVVSTFENIEYQLLTLIARGI